MPKNPQPAEGAKSRIDGELHRSIAAQIMIREAESAAGEDDGLLRLRLPVSSETPYLRASFFDEPWIEILGHSDGEIALDRLNGGAAVLANHDRHVSAGNTPLAAIGVVEKAWVEKGRLHADIALSRREALADLRQDISDGLVKNVSIGYRINERILIRAGGKTEPDEYRVTRWEPFEISLVDIPADVSVGLGRATDLPAAPYRVVAIPPAEGATTEGVKSMTDLSPPLAAGPVPIDPAPDLLAGERARLQEIFSLGRHFKMETEAENAIEKNVSADAFRKMILENLKDSGKLRPAETLEIGLTKKEIRHFSFCRALLAAADPLHAAQIAPFETACSRAAQDKRGDFRDKTREAALTIPADVLVRGIDLPEGAAAGALHYLAGRDATRDLVAGMAVSGGNLVATELLGSSFIELLRNAMVLDKLGITWLRDLSGNLAIPSQTGAATAYWVPESGAPVESQQTIGQIALTPKTVGAFTDYSRRLLLQSSIDVEAFVRADLAAIIGLAIQYAAINGSGTGNQPLGLLNASGIASVAGGTNGGAPTYDTLVDLETAIALADADAGKQAFLTNPKVRGVLRKTQIFTGTSGEAVWKPGRERGIGEALGYDAYVTNAVPSDLTKGTAAGVCSAILFGNWADLLIGLWGGLDIMLDPYAGATSGTKRVIALQDVDVTPRRVESFAVIKDALTA